MSLDRRLNPYRSDLAADSLLGAVEAERFVPGVLRGVVVGVAPVRRRPSHEASLDTQALFGEAVTVYEARDGWAWGQLERDGYVGYLPLDALGDAVTPTHKVVALRTHAYPGPSIKLPPLRALCYASQLRVERLEGEFAVTADGAHHWASHLAPLAAAEPDFVALAQRFVGVPYLWGGRSTEGIDCSGLAQTALTASHIKAPRDSDMQEAALGRPLPLDAALERGDFVFWRGHIGMMTGPQTLLHANGYHMLVVEEPLEQANRRTLERGGGPVTSIRRL